MSPRQSWRSRLRFRPLSVGGMAIVWVLLWGELSPFVLVSGIVVGWLVGAVFPLPPIYWSGAFHPWGAVKLGAGLLWDLTVSSVRLVRYAFQPGLALRPGIVRVDLISDNDLYQVQVAEMISLVPGTVVVEVVRNPRRLYLHIVDLDGPDAVAAIRTMAHVTERRALAAFGSPDEIAHFDETVEGLPEATTADDTWEDDE